MGREKEIPTPRVVEVDASLAVTPPPTQGQLMIVKIIVNVKVMILICKEVILFSGSTI